MGSSLLAQYEEKGFVFRPELLSAATSVCSPPISRRPWPPEQTTSA